MDHRFTCGERKSLVKHRKVSKYFETDCSYRLHKHISSITDERTTPRELQRDFCHMKPMFKVNMFKVNYNPGHNILRHFDV